MGIVFVFGVHCFFRVNAVQILKIGTVAFDHLAEDLCLHLVHELFKGIPINKKALPGGVCMEVKEELYIFQTFYELLHTPDGDARIVMDDYCFFLLQST